VHGLRDVNCTAFGKGLGLSCAYGTRVLQECYKRVTRVLQECCKSVTRVLQECYKSVTRVLQECYKRVTTSREGEERDE
jgi:hypothetical protein